MTDFAALKLCPDQLSSGLCGGSCSYQHDFRICSSCAVVVRPASAYNGHSGTTEHQHGLRSNFARCTICETNVPRQTWSAHITSQAHGQHARSRGLQLRVQPEVPAFVPGHKHCVQCNLFATPDEWRGHQQSPEHRQKVEFRDRIAAYVASTRTQAVDVDGEVKINRLDGVDFGIIEDDVARAGTTTHVIVTTSLRTLTLVNVNASSAQSTPKNRPFTARSQGPSPIIKAGIDYHVLVTFKPDPVNVGIYTGRLKLSFKNTETKKYFSVDRSLRATVGDPIDHEELRPVAPFVPPKKTSRPHRGNIVFSKRPPRFSRNPYKIKLDVYPLPQDISEALDEDLKDVGQKIFAIPYDYHVRTLTKTTYMIHMSALLWIEEHQARIDIQVYDMELVRLHKEKDKYILHVPGLAESRPSVLLGDGIMVQATGAFDEDKWFEGLVIEVRSEEVALQFPPRFSGWSASQTYSVRFGINRYPIRRQHQAINRPFNDDRVFFPLERHVKPLSTYVPNMNPMYNTRIAANEPQMRAVKAILRLSAGSHPFIIFGPPGTGKTSTCVEAILQLLRAQPACRIFACAPSNSAADVLSTRLLEALGQRGVELIYRFYAPSRGMGTAPKVVLPCTERRDNAFAVPPMDRVLKARIVISTCGSASFAYGIEVPQGHFTHILIDEAGQATEPEAMVPIMTMADRNTIVILSGDPKQLGAVIRSKVAKELGLGVSFLERLMQRQVYHEAEGDGRTIVKLVNNFRSHPDILYYPNNVFYGGDLRAQGPPEVINAHTKWSHLPKKTFPIIFHAVYGEDKRESTSPSYFNIDEITQVKKYVKYLLNDKKVPIKAEDIGIITPYYAQAMKMRTALRSMPRSAKDIQVASVELFQGQERRAIIMSTVRSTQDMLAHDLKYLIGFVANPRRFNVAITRAKSLLIIVGNPEVLGLDQLWREFLNWIFARGGWAGPPPSWDALSEARQAGGETLSLGLTDINEYALRMEALRLDDAAGDDVPDEDGHRVEE